MKEEEITNAIKMILKVFGVATLFLVVVAVFFLIYTKIQINRGDLVKWDGRWYTKEELSQKFPPQYYEAPAKNTPEEVYAAFRDDLLKNNTEGALSLITEKHREEYKQAFQDKEKFDAWVKRFPVMINQDNVLGNFASYHYYNSTNKTDTMAHPIEFIKNVNGYWEIDSI